MASELVACATSTAKAASGRIQWKIESWSALESVQGQYTSSPVMECAGHKWKLRVYPGGKAEKDDDTPAIKVQKKEGVGLYLLYKGTGSEKVTTQ